MSATPRPWTRVSLTITDQATGRSEPAGHVLCSPADADVHPDHLRGIATFERGEDAELAQRAVNAFDALLAVAKAYAGGLQKQIGPGVYQSCLKCGQPTLDVLHMSGCPIEPLDRDHPDWREWA